MGHQPDGAHTHGDGGGGGAGAAVVLVLAAVVAAAVAKPVIHAALAVLHVLLIAAIAVVSLGCAAGVGLLAWRLRRPRVTVRPMLAPRPVRNVQALPEPQALDRPSDVHLHLHGVGPEAIAQMLGGIQPGTTGWRVTSAPSTDEKP